MRIYKWFFMPVIAFGFMLPLTGRAQTDDDAIMMKKENFCVGASYSYSSWKDYWEGTFKRNNLNLGTVSTQMAGAMGNYGISDKLNVIVMAPYVWTHASAGTLHGMHGFQDLSAWLKWQTFEHNIGKGIFSVFLLGGASIPLSDYQADYLPLAIGLQSKTVSGRLMLDYQLGKFFVTASGTYTGRADITIDRNSYYTTSLHLTNKVDMPDVASFNFRTGYRTNRLVIEAVLANMTTLGGFDIRKNDMPFPSNKMESTTAGAHFRYDFSFFKGLLINGGVSYTIAGRNVGQATTADFGIFYTFDFSGKRHSSPLKPNQL